MFQQFRGVSSANFAHSGHNVFNITMIQVKQRFAVVTGLAHMGVAIRAINAWPSLVKELLRHHNLAAVSGRGDNTDYFTELKYRRCVEHVETFKRMGMCKSVRRHVFRTT